MSGEKTEKLAVLIDAYTVTGLCRPSKGGRNFYYRIQFNPSSNLDILPGRMQPTAL